jgi:hypothetical protein
MPETYRLYLDQMLGLDVARVLRGEVCYDPVRVLRLLTQDRVSV